VTQKGGGLEIFAKHLRRGQINLRKKRDQYNVIFTRECQKEKGHFFWFWCWLGFGALKTREEEQRRGLKNQGVQQKKEFPVPSAFAH